MSVLLDDPSVVHASWDRGQAPLCGEPGQAVYGPRTIIRTPADWARVTCALCHYAAGKGET